MVDFTSTFSFFHHALKCPFWCSFQKLWKVIQIATNYESRVKNSAGFVRYFYEP